MRKVMKALGFLSVLATVSDVSGMAEYLKPNSDITQYEIVSDDVTSEDFEISSPRKPRRSGTGSNVLIGFHKGTDTNG